MPYIPFQNYFPKIAERETRCVIHTELAEGDLPVGEYAFMELFCDECDCRRAVINVMNIESDNPLVATISYAWGTRSFYVRWLRRDIPEVIDEMMSTHLMRPNYQSEYAEEVLAMFKEMIEIDPDYEKRIRRHYSMFRKKMKGKRIGIS